MAAWDIFCTVVDNYGDAGITWRLAHQLVAEHGQQVRLWIDDLYPLARIQPGVDRAAEQQWHRGVEVRLWHADWKGAEPGDVVVEAFACQLPEGFIAAMARRAERPLWLNLEYLSAEEWIEGCHALPSLQPTGLNKYFFFPGFTPKVGGLLRERGLLAQRDGFLAVPEARADFLAGLGVQRQPGERLFSLFAYENPALIDWLDALSAGTQPTCLLVPEGRVLANVAAWLGVDWLKAGDDHRRGALRLQVLPFVSQQDYDRLLWCCDFNAVRGEDSFVRAQWAAKPFVWHIYPQEEEVHFVKLEAFLARYLEAAKPELAAALSAFWLAWNGRGDLAAAWSALGDQVTDWQELAWQWSEKMGARSDLAASLVHFYTDWLSYGASKSRSPIHTDNRMKTAQEFRAGQVAMIDNAPWVIQKAEYNKSGRNAAVVKMKLKSLLSGSATETVFRADDKLEPVILDRKEVTYIPTSPIPCTSSSTPSTTSTKSRKTIWAKPLPSSKTA
ncbi:putative repeat protein (TIGR03837 family) [Pseudomonas psychrotolerans]|nr:putative repeat protein (TIGR03837 family) [Pseudomonas psychrotolerans]